MKSIVLLVGLCIASMLFVGCDDKPVEQKRESNTTSIAFKFEAKTLDEKKIHIKSKDDIFTFDTNHDTVLLYLFDTSCVACKGAFPYLVSLQKKYTETLSIFSVGQTDATYDPRLAKELLLIRGALKLSYAPTNKPLIDAMLEHLRLPYIMPLSVLFHKGKIIKHYQGITPIEMIEADIRHILEEE